MSDNASSQLSFASSLKLSLFLVILAVLSFILGDFQLSTLNPWLEFKRMAQGLLAPRLLPVQVLFYALLQTIAYAVLAVAVASALGAVLALFYENRLVRMLCALIRSVHELFWALLFIQFFGLHPLSGLLALILPYIAIFAKVYAEMREELRYQAPPHLPSASGRLERFWFGDWPRLKVHWWTYTLYRLECGFRSSTLLGFIGLPTLGFHLEAAFLEGQYAIVAGLLILFYLLVSSLRFWMKPKLLWIYALIALYVLAESISINSTLALQLLQEMVPAPLRNNSELLPWLSNVIANQAWPGIVQTVLVSQVALVGSGLLALLLFPLVSKQFSDRSISFIGKLILVVLRSTPELFIAFALLLLWGPSLLPAVVALSLHNGAIIGHLVGNYSEQIQLRADASRGLNRYSYEIMPRLYGQFLAFSFYRWEVIMRDTAILGLLGIHTLGFYIDSAFESFQMDVAILLIACTAILNCLVDAIARGMRRWLHLKHSMVSAQSAY